MDFVSIIEKKRDGKTLTEQEIKFFIDEYANKNSIPEYQVSSLLMAIFFQGLNDFELSVLTKEMLHTGKVLDFSEYEGVFVDKHSTGGVGDKTSLVVGPIFAACDLKFAKMSGRGLGFTGGTLDKLESIPGYNVEIGEKQFFEQVEKIGIAIIGQSSDMVFADKKLYSLRDVTGTVPSIPLIASSIMSKKLASGAQVILLDVKYGDGAFMKTKQDALQLAARMKAIGESAGRKVNCEITSMQDVLGKMVGNSLEVKEAIGCLKGDFEKDFEELCLHSTETILKASGVVKSDIEARKMFYQAIDSGSALKKFKEMVLAQGGDASVVDDETKLNISPYKTEVKSERSGFLNKFFVEDIGLFSVHLGAGRLELGQEIDPSVGLEVHKKTGDRVEKGETIFTLYHKKDADKNSLVEKAKDLFLIDDEKTEPEPLVYKTI
jgi:pyrimidine-nucleoside phosphorylase